MISPKIQMTFPISVMADTLKLHQRTLRIYDEENLLVPSRSPKNRRQYSFADLKRGELINHLLQDLGMNVAGVKILFATLTALNVPEDKWESHISSIAGSLGIDKQQQSQNRARLSSRGRKKKERLVNA